MNEYFISKNVLQISSQNVDGVTNHDHENESVSIDYVGGFSNGFPLISGEI